MKGVSSVLNLQNLLKWIELSASTSDLFTIQDAVKRQFAQLDQSEKLERREKEAKEREDQWKLWKDTAQTLMKNGKDKKDAIAAAYNTLSNMWIERNSESTCSKCLKDYDEYFEHVFHSSIQLCGECAESIDRSYTHPPSSDHPIFSDFDVIFDEMSDELQETKKRSIESDNHEHTCHQPCE